MTILLIHPSAIKTGEMELMHIRMMLMTLSMIMHGIWTLSIDIVLGNGAETMCKQVMCRIEDSANNITWIIHSSDTFTGAKVVNGLQAHLIVIARNSPCPDSYNNPNETNSCGAGWDFHNAVTNRSHVYIQDYFLLSDRNRSLILDTLLREESLITTKLRSIETIVLHERWKNYVLITSTYADIGAMTSRMALPVTQMMYVVDDDTDISSLLEPIFSSLKNEDLRFIVLCSFDCILKLLHKALMLEVKFAKRSRWLVLPTRADWSTLLQSNVTFKTSEVIFIQYQECWQHYPVVNLDILLKNGTEEITNRLNECVEVFTSSNDTMADIYSIGETAEIYTLNHRGTIAENGVISNMNLYQESKYGFNNRTFTVALLKWKPFIMKEERNGSVSYSGISLDLLMELSRSLNFSYTLVEPEDQEWGQNKDGNWSGLVGLMANKKADLVIAPIAVEASRENVMDFTLPYFYVHSTVILNKPTSQKVMTLVAPFRYEVHICILFSLIFSTVFLFAMEEVNPMNTWTQTHLCMRRMRFGDILWYHFGALMANGGAYLPNTQSGRTILSCWWLFTVISAATYSGNLIAFLTDWREKLPFSSLAEMVQQDAYTWGTIKGSAILTLFQKSNRSDYKKLGEGIEQAMVSDPNVLSADNAVHLQKVLNGGYAYIGDVSLLDVFKADHCGLQMLNDRFFSLNYAVGLPNNSIYTDVFSREILRISESGLVNIWYKNWMPLNRCDTNISAKRVDLLALQGLFYAAAVGVVLALLVLLIELVFKNKGTCLHHTSASDNQDDM